MCHKTDLTLHVLNNILLDPKLGNASVIVSVVRMEMPETQNSGRELTVAEIQILIFKVTPSFLCLTFWIDCHKFLQIFRIWYRKSYTP